MPVGSFKQPRSEERFAVRVPVTMQIGKKRLQLFTGDVSFRGLFIRTDSPPELRQLIALEIELPPTMTAFKSHGMSMYSLRPGHVSGRSAGVGIQFYAQAAHERQAWESFVDHIRHHPPELPPDAVDPVKRHHPRIEARFEVRPKNVVELETIYSRDISSGGMFLETDMGLAVGKTCF